jgi:hypothetical protein
VNTSLHIIRNAFCFVWQLNWWRNTKLTRAYGKAYEEIEEELLLLDREPIYIFTILLYQTWVNLLLSPFYFICLAFNFGFNATSFTEVLLSLGVTTIGFLLHRAIDKVFHFARYIPFTQPVYSYFMSICCSAKILCLHIFGWMGKQNVRRI